MTSFSCHLRPAYLDLGKFLLVWMYKISKGKGMPDWVAIYAFVFELLKDKWMAVVLHPNPTGRGLRNWMRWILLFLARNCCGNIERPSEHQWRVLLLTTGKYSLSSAVSISLYALTQPVYLAPEYQRRLGLSILQQPCGLLIPTAPNLPENSRYIDNDIWLRRLR